MKNIKQYLKIGICTVLASAIIVASVPEVFMPENIWADESSTEAKGDDVTIKSSDKPYLALGADLSAEQKQTVLNYMGISEDKLDNYDVTYVTNQEEHEYLDNYISSSEIGSRALSSVVITKAEKGDGLSITTYNIDYCTVGMYKNALTTAGISDANIIVAGPFSLSGTCALVGIMKAYEDMTGSELDESLVDGAVDEITTTGELEENLSEEDSQKLEAMIAELKEEIASGDLSSEDAIKEEIKNKAAEYGLELTDAEIEKLLELLDKIRGLDLDWDAIAQQASQLQKTISSLWNETSGVRKEVSDYAKSEEGKSTISKFLEWLKQIIEKLLN